MNSVRRSCRLSAHSVAIPEENTVVIRTSPAGRVAGTLVLLGVLVIGTAGPAGAAASPAQAPTPAQVANLLASLPPTAKTALLALKGGCDDAKLVALKVAARTAPVIGSALEKIPNCAVLQRLANRVGSR